MIGAIVQIPGQEKKPLADQTFLGPAREIGRGAEGPARRQTFAAWSLLVLMWMLMVVTLYLIWHKAAG
jgi:hypothetical protein